MSPFKYHLNPLAEGEENGVSIGIVHYAQGLSVSALVLEFTPTNAKIQDSSPVSYPG